MTRTRPRIQYIIKWVSEWKTLHQMGRRLLAAVLDITGYGGILHRNWWEDNRKNSTDWRFLPSLLLTKGFGNIMEDELRVSIVDQFIKKTGM